MNCSYKVDNRSRRICDESGSRKVSGSIDENHNHPGNTNDRPIFTRCDPVCNEHTHTRTGVDRPTDRHKRNTHRPETRRKHREHGSTRRTGTRIPPGWRWSAIKTAAVVYIHGQVPSKTGREEEEWEETGKGRRKIK